MIEICAFEPDEIGEAIAGLNGLQDIIVPILKDINYESKSENDALRFQRHIMMGKHALGLMSTQMITEDNGPLTEDKLRLMNEERVYVQYADFGIYALVAFHRRGEENYDKDDGEAVWLTNNLGGRSCFEEVTADGGKVYRVKPADSKEQNI